MQISQLFRKLGLKRGDHIAFMLENHPALLQITLGAQRSGLYFTAISYRLQEDEVDYIVSDCEAKVFITSKAQQAVAEKMNLENCQNAFMLDGAIAGFDSLEDALDETPAEKIVDESTGIPINIRQGRRVDQKVSSNLCLRKFSAKTLDRISSRWLWCN